MTVAGDIEAVQARLGVVGTVADTLAVAWDIFELIQVVANSCADREPGLFAAFLFAAAAAAEGRDAAGFAPSIPDSPGMAVSPPVGDVTAVPVVADELAALAGVLGGRLELAAGQAGDLGDRQACVHAARQAHQVHELLTAGP